MRHALLLACVLSLTGTSLCQAQVIIPQGATLELGGGTLEGGGTAVTVHGGLHLGTGRLQQVGDFTLGPGGNAGLGSGAIQLSGTWNNQGTLAAGSSRIQFVDGPETTSSLLGSTRFASLDMSSARGKRYHLESGQTQTVAGSLRIRGSAAPIQIDVTTPGAVAFLDLLASGSQDIAHVGVSDVHAIGQHLAPQLHNEGGRGNDDGWFGDRAGATPAPLPVPSRSAWSTLLLAALLVFAALRIGHRTR